jgi:hypothetical protein
MPNNFCAPRLIAIVWAVLMAANASAAPLPKGTLLSIKQGAIAYPEGNCSGSYVRYLNDAINCHPLGPGLDGGLVVGKNQKSGGQETIQSGRRGQDGDLSSVFSRFGYATLATAPMQGVLGGNAGTDAALNRFDDVSCSAAACLGKVEINTLHQAFQGQVLPGGCAVADCAATGGSGVKSWVVNPDRSYRLDASWGQTQLHLEGTIVLPGNRPPVAADLEVGATAGQVVHWKPRVSDVDGDKLSCTLLPSRPGFYGTLTIAPDCAIGVYIPPNSLFTGRQCRQYQVSDGKNVSAPAEVCVKILPQQLGGKRQRI